jgi:hypothetical protein
MSTNESNDLMTVKTTRKGSREEALHQLVPKMLGILCEEGQSSRLPSSRLVVLPTGVEVSACYLAPSRIMLSSLFAGERSNRQGGSPRMSLSDRSLPTRPSTATSAVRWVC